MLSDALCTDIEYVNVMLLITPRERRGEGREHFVLQLAKLLLNYALVCIIG